MVCLWLPISVVWILLAIQPANTQHYFLPSHHHIYSPVEPIFYTYETPQLAIAESPTTYQSAGQFHQQIHDPLPESAHNYLGFSYRTQDERGASAYVFYISGGDSAHLFERSMATARAATTTHHQLASNAIDQNAEDPHDILTAIASALDPKPNATTHTGVQHYFLKAKPNHSVKTHLQHLTSSPSHPSSAIVHTSTTTTTPTTHANGNFVSTSSSTTTLRPDVTSTTASATTGSFANSDDTVTITAAENK